MEGFIHTASVVPTRPNGTAVEDLRNAILRLEERKRLVLCLHRMEGLTLDQIAVVMDEPEEEIAALFYWAHVETGACADLLEACAA